MASASARQVINPQILYTNKLLFSAHQSSSNKLAFANDKTNINLCRKLCLLVPLRHQNSRLAVRSAAGKANMVSADEEGVSLGTMKLPLDTDITRFESLLFQWANSLCQGAQLPLPVPLKVDKIEGGVRLGFAEIDDGQTSVPVYINCQVIPGSNESEPPMFKATRNGAQKNRVPPGEPRIMKSLLAALKTSVEIARI